MKKLFNLEISDELKEDIRLEAFERKTTLSEAARYILESYFENKKCKKKN